jgi:DNA excision repair protein ERCC-4
MKTVSIHEPNHGLCCSPHATGELFEELKKGREEPDPAKAAGVTVDAADEFNTDKYHPTIMDFLSKLPGVTTKNIFALMNRLENMSDLLEQSLEDLTEILGHSGNAKELYDCLHENLCPVEEQSAANKAKSKGARFKTGKAKV